MAGEIIRVRSASYARYEELLTRREELRKELAEYRDYGKQLEEILNGLLKEGVKLVWQMN